MAIIYATTPADLQFRGSGGVELWTGSGPPLSFKGFDLLSDVPHHPRAAFPEADPGQARASGDPVYAGPGTLPAVGQLVGGDVRRLGWD